MMNFEQPMSLRHSGKRPSFFIYSFLLGLKVKGFYLDRCWEFSLELKRD